MDVVKIQQCLQNKATNQIITQTLFPMEMSPGWRCRKQTRRRRLPVESRSAPSHSDHKNRNIYGEGDSEHWTIPGRGRTIMAVSRRCFCALQHVLKCKNGNERNSLIKWFILCEFCHTELTSLKKCWGTSHNPQLGQILLTPSDSGCSEIKVWKLEFWFRFFFFFYYFLILKRI